MRTKNPVPCPALCAKAVASAEPGLVTSGADPFGNVFPFVPATGQVFRPKLIRCSEQVLAELLALNEEMIEQLHAERRSVAGSADFIIRMIDHHESAAVLLRAQLEGAGPETV